MIRSFLYTAVLAVVSLLLMSQSCEDKKNNTDEVAVDSVENIETEKPEMEMLAYSFTGSYEDLWVKVDSLEDDGLYKSALEVVNTIFDAAKASSSNACSLTAGEDTGTTSSLSGFVTS